MSTPRKKVPESCFLCDRKRYYNFCGKKCDDLLNKLSCLSNGNFENFENFCKSKDLGICRPCADKAHSAYSFVNNLKEKCSENDSLQNERYKRMTLSPLTPNLSSDTTAKVVKKAKTRRSLIPLNSEQSNDICEENTEDEVPYLQVDEHNYCHTGPVSSSCISEHGEHGYSAPVEDVVHCNLGKGDCATLETLKKSFQDNQESNDTIICQIVNRIVSNQVVLKAVKSRLLNDIDIGCSTLVSKNVALGSILSRYRSVTSLVENGDQLLDELIREMSERMPFLLEIFTVIATAGGEPSASKIAPVAAAYSILMNARNNHLSAWHRLTTFVAIKGHLDDSALLRLNHMGVTMSPTSKLRLLDEAGERMNAGIASKLATNPLVKVTGDNLDIYIRTGHKSLDRTNKDLHLFASNIIFSRIAKPGQYSIVADRYQLDSLRPEKFFPSGHFRQTLINSYCVLLGRVLVELKAFSWLKPVVPAHIYHPYHTQMSQKSHVYQLPILMKNEAKHEDCVDILDEYEKILGDIFVQSFGSEDLLQKFKVPVGGDQLTRVRLEEAKNLRTLATTPKKRFEDLHPFIIELWHTKQDFLEKCYKELYSASTLRQPGTLYHYKAKLQQGDVNGNVKSAFKSHHNFLLLIGKQMITEQFLEYFGMDDISSEPSKNIPTVSRSVSDRDNEMHNMLGKFITHYGYLNDEHETSDIKTLDRSDTVYNYACNVCHWVLQLMMMEDVVKEGDIVRLVPTMMYTLQFFFSHSRLSKYFGECLDFLLKSQFLLSPMQSMRVLEGAFTNLKGGLGKNIESDLVQENSVCNQKDLIRSLGANKTEKAIMRSTRAADTVALICENVDSSVKLKKSGTKHHIPKAEKDEKVVSASLRELRPFMKTAGRSCQGRPNILSSPLMKIDNNDFKYRIRQVVSRLYYGQTYNAANESDNDEDDD